MQQSDRTGDGPTPRRRLFSGLRVVSLCTLASRVLGLVRDIGMASLFGNGAVLDAFSVAFRVPNLARRLFGEGALTAAFLPIFVRETEQVDQQSAWRLAATVFSVLLIVLSALVLLGELLLWAATYFWDLGAEARLLIGLTAIMLPYLILICLSAQLSAILHALGRFTWPALLPILLNVVWIAGIWWLAPRFSTEQDQIHVIAACIVAAGFLQLITPLPVLFRLGFRFAFQWQATRSRIAEISRAMLPVLVGISVTQLNTVADSLIAWGFSQPELTTDAARLPGGIDYPLQSGTASALYFGQRMYQFPFGVFAIALGTVLFPVLSRHAERGRLDLLRDDLQLGLRLVLGIGLPASAGLILLAGPLTDLLFRHGAFDAADAEQTVSMITAYAIGVWAYSGLLILHRGYYAFGDRITPMRIGLIALVINLILNFTLIWFLGGMGLALATAIAAIIQLILVAWLIQARLGPLGWSELFRTAVRATAATAVMGAVCLLTLAQLEAAETIAGRLTRVAVPLITSLVAYFAAARLLGLDELGLLFRSGGAENDDERE